MQYSEDKVLPCQIKTGNETGQGGIKKRINCNTCLFSHYYSKGSVNRRGREKLCVVCQWLEKGSRETPAGIGSDKWHETERDQRWPQEGRPIPECLCQQEAPAQQAPQIYEFPWLLLKVPAYQQPMPGPVILQQKVLSACTLGRCLQ